MTDFCPGLNPKRLIRLMKTAIESCQIDLSSFVVLTEAASGAYVVTPVLAAMAGAKRVFALTRTTHYGTAEQIRAQTLDLARLAGVEAQIEIVTEKTPEIFAVADIVTNSGHVRPIDAEMVSWMKPTAVIALMYEAWELRPEDIDFVACRQRQIPLAGTNERHPAVDVFSYLGMMAVKLLLDAGIATYHSHVLVLCDNPFGPFLLQGLHNAGACVEMVDRLADASDAAGQDAILVALQPEGSPAIGSREAVTIARRYPDAVVAQFLGDLDRAALSVAGVPFWPLKAPAPGHMGILPSAIGPAAIVKLQAGGLKVGQIMASVRSSHACRNGSNGAVAAAVASGFGQAFESATALQRIS
jgi:hypothetical protein